MPSELDRLDLLEIADELGVSPDSASATLKAAVLSAFSFCGSTPDGDVSPENFYQSPVRLNKATTASVGWAPTDSQY